MFGRVAEKGVANSKLGSLGLILLRIICKVLSHKVTKNLADNTTFLAINRLIINQLDTFSVNPTYSIANIFICQSL